METLMAFIREHARWKEPDKTESETMVSLHDNEKAGATPQPPAVELNLGQARAELAAAVTSKPATPSALKAA